MVQAVARLSAVSFVCPVVTVQSCIAKGPFSAAEFNIWFAQFAADFHSRGARVVGPCLSPSLHRTIRVQDGAEHDSSECDDLTLPELVHSLAVKGS